MPKIKQETLIKQHLQLDWSSSDRSIAKTVGVSPTTVGKVRKCMNPPTVCPVDTKDTSTNLSNYPFLFANKSTLDKLSVKSKQVMRNVDILKMMEQRKSLSPRYCQRLINQAKKNSRQIKPNESVPNIIFKCDDLTTGLPWLKSSSCDIVCLDPPYGSKSIDKLYHAIADVSNRILKDGGSLLVMVGSASLGKAIAMLDSVDGLNYHYDLVVTLSKGGSSQTLQQFFGVTSQHKNILWFIKGKYNNENMPIPISTLIDSAPPDKKLPKLHKWQQDQHTFDILLSRFVQKPDTVLADLCMGSGTTIISAIRTGLCSTVYGVDCDKAAVATAKNEVKKEIERIIAPKDKEK